MKKCKKVITMLLYAAGVTIGDPRKEQNDAMEAGQKVTYDCVWFGSCP